MFKRAFDGSGAGNAVVFSFDGEQMHARSGDSVAAALAANGVKVVRYTPGEGSPRGPYCMMGVCFDCLVTIDGVVNQQACLVAVAQGMVVRTQERPMPLLSTEGGGR
ncbi:(2Fe-2S)-binding protein [Bordetella sp. 2513F-2]